VNRSSESFEPPVAAPAPAASLVPVREAAAELQVYLLRRSPSTGFMPGYYVFPGGRVDAWDRDAGFWQSQIDLAPEAFRKRLGEDFGSGDALAHAAAAIRETYEEAGVFLAQAPNQTAEGFDGLHDQRRRGILAPGWMARGAASAGWILRVSTLSPWARWITPAAMPRRFDTPFFAAVVPDDQECSPDFREATDGLWIQPRRALMRNLAGETPLSPPTLVTLQELSGCSDLASLRRDLVDRRWARPILPRLVELHAGAGSVIIEPWDPDYGRESWHIDPERLARSVLPAGEPFSRLWNRDGIWRPIGVT